MKVNVVRCFFSSSVAHRYLWNAGVRRFYRLVDNPQTPFVKFTKSSRRACRMRWFEAEMYELIPIPLRGTTLLFSEEKGILLASSQNFTCKFNFEATF